MMGQNDGEETYISRKHVGVMSKRCVIYKAAGKGTAHGEEHAWDM